MAGDIELSEREIEILRLVATGASNKQIAQDLFISANTVKVHLRNIFAKIGVVSRTEATLYAIREGLVSSPNPPAAEEALETVNPATLSEPEAEPLAEALPAKKRPVWLIAGLAALALVLAIFLGGLAFSRLAAPSPNPTFTPSPTQSRWQERAPMPEGRAGMAAAVYENAIYAIGGETEQGVTGSVIRYNPDTDAWTAMQAKPIAVTDVEAVTIGGKIYVPGGKLASGQPTDALEVYNPRTDRWEDGASLPIKVSGYALAAFEGKLYLFGGWDGAGCLKSAFRYEPETDSWLELTSMPTAREFAGAAVVSGKIYVIGGQDGDVPLDVNEVYTPEEEGEEPWSALSGTPKIIPHSKVTSLLDSIYIYNGVDQSGSAAILRYQPQSNLYSDLAVTGNEQTDGASLLSVDMWLYLVGGKTEGNYENNVHSFQIFYTIHLPNVSN